MHFKFKFPLRVRDPESFWKTVSAGVGLLAIIFFVYCLILQGENTVYRSNLQNLSEFNRNLSDLHEQQRTVISQIGDGLGQVMVKLDQIAEEQRGPGIPLSVAEVGKPEPEAEASLSDGHARTLIADLNGDGIVDWKDFEIFTQDWDKTGESLSADFNDDQVVDWTDFQIFLSQWMKTEPWFEDDVSIANRR